MSLRPRLKVRLGPRGEITSNSTSQAHGYGIAFVVVVAAALGVAAWFDSPWYLLALLGLARIFRDSVAWFAAPQTERDQYLAELAALRAQGHQAPDERTEFGQGWGRGVWMLLAGATAASLLLGYAVHPALASLTMLPLAVALLLGLDRLRSRRKTRPSR